MRFLFVNLFKRSGVLKNYAFSNQGGKSHGLQLEGRQNLDRGVLKAIKMNLDFILVSRGSHWKLGRAATGQICTLEESFWLRCGIGVEGCDLGNGERRVIQAE